jgi:hypothetical protein
VAYVGSDPSSRHVRFVSGTADGGREVTRHEDGMEYGHHRMREKMSRDRSLHVAKRNVATELEITDRPDTTMHSTNAPIVRATANFIDSTEKYVCNTDRKMLNAVGLQLGTHI